MHRLLCALPVALLAGCGLFAPPPPDTPAETVFREQVGVLEGVVKTVEGAKESGDITGALVKLKQYKEKMTALQTRRLELDPKAEVGDYNDDVKSAWSSVTKRLTQARFDLRVRGGVRGELSAYGEVADAADAVADVLHAKPIGK